MGRKRAQRALKRIFLMLLMSVWPLLAVAQSGYATVDALVKMGFENVSVAENSNESIRSVDVNVISSVGVESENGKLLSGLGDADNEKSVTSLERADAAMLPKTENIKTLIKAKAK